MHLEKIACLLAEASAGDYHVEKDAPEEWPDSPEAGPLSVLESGKVADQGQAEQELADPGVAAAEQVFMYLQVVEETPPAEHDEHVSLSMTYIYKNVRQLKQPAEPAAAITFMQSLIYEPIRCFLTSCPAERQCDSFGRHYHAFAALAY